MIDISFQGFIKEATARICGFQEYSGILELFEKTDVSADIDFQRKFTHYYRIFWRSKEWREKYYNLFQRLRKNAATLDFATVLDGISKFSNGAMEVSFASKMLATIRPEMPIWDKYIRINFDLPELPAKNTSDRRDAAIAAYSKLCERMNALLSSEKVLKEIAAFDKAFPQYAWFSNVKKLDFFVWSANRA